ncbi:PREDICTED: mesenchyme-specific cell surface glycoprotein-like [Branchiostoma belcheri]|uniref:Mesenchyme-specific cell surface glycoprotein-like n=1 Tax=Branchiostoma belcheri TaxID=7741 RepID=A0A6P4XVI2_BRABE|nr:PREDICTED: mesenchyme-specific cell surface glycoprotein-like [Branchiostoma belcheri]
MALLYLMFFCVLTTGQCIRLGLEHLSTVYLPYRYDSDGDARYKMGKGAAEQVGYDADNKKVYSVGQPGLLNVIDVSDPHSISLLHHQELPQAGQAAYTDVEYCGGFVALSREHEHKGLPGHVLIYEAYRGAGDMRQVYQARVGGSPDMLLFTRDCRKLIVANEGKDGGDGNGNFLNPEGSLTIIDFSSDDLPNSDHIQTRTVNFRKFDERQDEYAARGVRWVYRGEEIGIPNRLSEELEPEYVTLSKDETKAYVGLQENNAVIVVDLVTATAEELYPLGAKYWGDSGLDPSDKDGGIHIAAWPIYGLYQPDTVKYVSAGGRELLITSNEGNTRALTVNGIDINDEWRGTDFVENDALASSVSPMLRDALRDETKLGVLRFSNYDGKSASDPTKYEAFYAFGGRGFSVWDAKNLTQIWDSGDQVERAHAMYYPSIFNSEFEEDFPHDHPEDTMDETSKKKGPQSESLAVGEAFGKTVIVLGNERTSTLMLYALDTHNPHAVPEFQSIYRHGRWDRRWDSAYDDREVGDIDPEDIKFIPHEASPDGHPMLLVAGSLSGTVTLYRVINTPL